MNQSTSSCNGHMSAVIVTKQLSSFVFHHPHHSSCFYCFNSFFRRSLFSQELQIIMKSSNEDPKRQREDQEPEEGSSKKAKVKMAPSAFKAQPGKTITSVYIWEKTIEDLEEEDRFDSDVFGSKKHSFYLRFKEHISNYGYRWNDYYNEGYQGDLESRDFNMYLCLNDESLENEVFIKKLAVNAHNYYNGHSTLHNDVLTKDSPLKLGTVKVRQNENNYLKVSLKITFKESCDDWNSYYSKAPVNHAEVLCQQLANVTNSLPSDVTLKTMSDGQLFPAHKFILQMRSPVFAAMFSGDFVENKVEKPVEICEITGPVMKSMLAYVYCKPFENWKMMAGELAVAADMYNIQSLFDSCIASLLDDITVENAAKNFYYARLFNSTNLKDIAKYIDFRKDEVKLTDGWKELTEERDGWLEKQLAEVLE